MKDRCLNSKGNKYEAYGARGIKVCDRWMVFDSFLADMGARPAGMTLERKDGNGNYEPSNCKWAGYAEQNRNRSNTLWFEKDGIKMTVIDWCRKIGQSYKSVAQRIYRGWEYERALFTPVGAKR
jgi:hypothetical protein